MLQIVIDSSPGIMGAQWREEQVNDKDTALVIELIKKCKLMQYKVRQEDPIGLKILVKYRKELVLKKELLYQKVHLKSQAEVVFQFVLPRSFQHKTVLAFHNKMGQMGMDKTLVMLQSRFFWPKCHKM